MLLVYIESLVIEKLTTYLQLTRSRCKKSRFPTDLARFACTVHSSKICITLSINKTRPPFSSFSVRLYDCVQPFLDNLILIISSPISTCLSATYTAFSSLCQSRNLKRDLPNRSFFASALLILANPLIFR